MCLKFIGDEKKKRVSFLPMMCVVVLFCFVCNRNGETVMNSL